MGRKPSTGIRLGEAVKQFMEDLELTKLAASKFEAKAFTLRYLVKAAGGPHRMTTGLTDEHFTACLKDLQDGAKPAEALWRRQNKISPRRGRSLRSLAGDRYNLRQFVNYCVHKKWVEPSFNPLYEITRAKRAQGDVEPEDVHEMERIPLAQWAGLIEAMVHPRDRMIIAIGLWWGTRASTMSRIQIKHLNADGVGLRLFNKKMGKWYEAKVHAGIRPELDRYLAWYKASYGELQPDWYLVPSKVRSCSGLTGINAYCPQDWPMEPTKRADPERISRMVKEKAFQGVLGWSKERLWQEGAHTLRRSSAKEVHQYGDLESAATQLDDTSHSVVLGYTQNSGGQRKRDEAIERMVAKTVPAPRAPEPEPSPEVVQVDFQARRRIA